MFWGDVGDVLKLIRVENVPFKNDSMACRLSLFFCLLHHLHFQRFHYLRTRSHSLQKHLLFV